MQKQNQKKIQMVDTPVTGDGYGSWSYMPCYI